MSKMAKYAPELFELYRKGSMEAVSVTLPNVASAITLRNRLNYLRADMRTENHHMLNTAESCVVALSKDRLTVTVKPVDVDYLVAVKEALEREGVDINELHDENVNVEDSSQPNPSEEALSKFFGGSSEEEKK